MAFKFTLQKLLELIENKKLEVEAEYSQASRVFEESATKLYHLLKKKEEYEDSYQNQIKDKLSILHIQQSQAVLMKIGQEIVKQQVETNIARENLQRKQEALLNISIELKKYEKMKELKHLDYLEQAKREESKLMDELAVLQYVNR